jgi:hypothetical protein
MVHVMGLIKRNVNVAKAKRNYKKEYAKFGKSSKAKKKRAELNKYNRKKGTYGNGDGKDASHKGGKIVGFEKSSVNKGRAEKSRLKGSKRKKQEGGQLNVVTKLRVSKKDVTLKKIITKK